MPKRTPCRAKKKTQHTPRLALKTKIDFTSPMSPPKPAVSNPKQKSNTYATVPWSYGQEIPNLEAHMLCRHTACMQSTYMYIYICTCVYVYVYIYYTNAYTSHVQMLCTHILYICAYFKLSCEAKQRRYLASDFDPEFGSESASWRGCEEPVVRALTP